MSNEMVGATTTTRVEGLAGRPRRGWAVAALGYGTGAITYGILMVAFETVIGQAPRTLASFVLRGGVSAVNNLLFSVIFFGILWGYAGVRLLGSRPRFPDVIREVGRAFVWPWLVALVLVLIGVLFGFLTRGSIDYFSYDLNSVLLLAVVATWVWAMASATNALMHLGSLGAWRVVALLAWLVVVAAAVFAAALWVSGVG